MTAPRPPANVQTSRQLVLAALAESGLLVGITVFFWVRPQTTLTIVLAAVPFAIGLALAIVTIYRAVPLLSEPQTRTIGYISIALLVVGPITLFAVSQFAS